MNIDWSKAPEGFPVWIESHYKHDPSDWHVKVEKGYKDRKGGLWFDHQVEAGECTVHVRPEYTGEGLPPVGIVCEFTHDGSGVEGRWIKCTILGYGGKGEFGETVAVSTDDSLFEDSGGLSVQHALHEILWRPIRTAEQIAASERESAVDDMVRIALHQSYVITPAQAKIVFERIYDAGYRKVQP